MLTVATASNTLTAPLTGTGIPDLTGSPASLNFGNVDIGGSSTPQVVTFTNTATAAVPVPQILTTGDFAVTTTCGSTIAALSTCTISVTFKPTATGARNGTLTVNSSAAAYSGLSTALTGNGVDFSLKRCAGLGVGGCGAQYDDQCDGYANCRVLGSGVAELHDECAGIDVRAGFDLVHAYGGGDDCGEHHYDFKVHRGWLWRAGRQRSAVTDCAGQRTAAVDEAAERWGAGTVQPGGGRRGVSCGNEFAGDGMLRQVPGAECSVHGAWDLYIHADGYGWLSHPYRDVYSDRICELA